LGLPSKATRARPGAISLSIASHLPVMLASNDMTPVRLPPGRSQACDEAGTDRIGDVGKHDGDFSGFPLHRGHRGRRLRE
jgi:hypothetical protein